jgi:alpha-soluble NSF attachment protein
MPYRYLFKAGLCQLATNDMVAAKRAINERYPEMDNSFPQQREYMFLGHLLECVENSDPEKFSQAAFDFDQVQKLDKFKTDILLRIKQNIEKADEDFS